MPGREPLPGVYNLRGAGCRAEGIGEVMRHGNCVDRSSGVVRTRWWGLGILALAAGRRPVAFLAAELPRPPRGRAGAPERLAGISCVGWAISADRRSRVGGGGGGGRR